MQLNVIRNLQFSDAVLTLLEFLPHETLNVEPPCIIVNSKTNLLNLNFQEKRRARKTSEDETLDEEFLNKTYNPKKQDKYTLFTPHALDSIEEESTSMLSMSITL